MSFELYPGEALAVLGANGAGKTTLLRILNGLLKPDRGCVQLNGTMAALLELGSGFHPVLTGRENIRINAALLGMPERLLPSVTDSIIEFAELEKVIDAPVRSYSTGMSLRLAYAIATHLKPDLMLIDEVLAVGDIAFQRKCINHLLTFIRNGGSLVIVSHSPFHIQSVCNRALLLDAGKPVFLGTAIEGLSRYFELVHWHQAEAPPDAPAKPLPEKPPASDSRVEAAVEATVPEENLGGEEPRRSEPPAAEPLPGVPEDVVIERVEIESADGRPLRLGEDIRITLHYRSELEPMDVHWGFAIFAGHEQACVSCEFSEEKWRLGKGAGRFTCRIARTPLLPGAYALHAFIVDPATLYPLALLGWNTPAKIFAVHGEQTMKSNALAAIKALVAMDVRWREEN